MLRDPGKHLRSDLILIMEGELKIRPTISRQQFVRPGLSLQLPADSLQRGEYTLCLASGPPAHWLPRMTG